MQHRALHYSRQFLLLAVLCVSAAVHAAQQQSPNPIELLDSMSRATSGLNFDGTFIYMRGDQIDSMRLIHKSGDEGEFERLVSLTGAGREVIRDRETVTCIFPDNRAGMMEDRGSPRIFPDLNAERLRQMSAFYRFNLAGHDRVANRETWVVDIIPDGPHRYGYRFWLDQETHLLLRSKLVDRKGHTLEQIMFTSIEYPEVINDQLLMPALSGKGYTWHLNETEQARRAETPINWHVNWVPGGFQMHGHEVHHMASSKMPVEHMVYSDGLATVSVFVEEMKDPAEAMLGYSMLGAVNTYSAMSGGYLVTVVGELPPKTIRQIADSLSMNQ